MEKIVKKIEDIENPIDNIFKDNIGITAIFSRNLYFFKPYDTRRAFKHERIFKD